MSDGADIIVILVTIGIVVGIVLIGYFGDQKPDTNQREASPNGRAAQHRPSPSSPTASSTETRSRSPRVQPSVQQIRWTEQSGQQQGRGQESASDQAGNQRAWASSTNTIDADLVDPLTGIRLVPSLGLFQCQVCKVIYQTASFELLRRENSSRCVSCSSTNVVAITTINRASSANAHVTDVTLSNYSSHEGRMITFRGRVHVVRESSRGGDYALMFEDKSWTKGFKAMVFKSDVQKVGGTSYLYQLNGKDIRLRGLLVKHPIFGYEIIVSDRAMILEVR